MNARLKEIDADEYEDYLNEVYGTIHICGTDYNAGDVLRQIDPIAFEAGKDDYEDSRDIWVCDECGAEHDNREDAESCCDWADNSVIGVGDGTISQVFALPSVDALAKKKEKPKPWIVNLP